MPDDGTTESGLRNGAAKARPSSPALRFKCGWRFERAARREGATLIAGVDEVGRGSLFGPVVAAAVIFAGEPGFRHLRDSKQLTPAERAAWERRIQRRALAWAVAELDSGRIEVMNILQASRRAMLAAVAQLRPSPDFLLVDALHLDWPGPQQAIIHGDARSASIAAASILAKEHRDRLIRAWDTVYPAYRLGQNKGYATREHRQAIARWGLTPLHRRSFCLTSVLEQDDAPAKS